MTCFGKRGSRKGQSLIFFLMILVILVFVVLWNFDLHKILHTKSITQNAGDASAVMAARWQAITLNLIGDLNLMHAVALCNDDMDSASAITNIQARLCFTGPMIALLGAQQAAKNNKIYSNPAYSAFLAEHAQAVRSDYPTQTDPDGDMLFPEPYPGAWAEYADMLDYIAAEGVAAGPDNMRLYMDRSDGHHLLMPDFYDAVAGRNWCWFYLDGEHLLEEYENFFPCWWPSLPPIPNIQYINAEIYGLGLVKRETRLSHLLSTNELVDFAAEREMSVTPTNTAMNMIEVWYCYGYDWREWDTIKRYGPNNFPATGNLKPQFDYAGADACTRIEATMDRLSPGPRGRLASDTITWTAAAKPFGYLNESDRPNSFGLVLPAFRQARLIPVDTSSAPAGGGYNLEWRRHIEVHLDEYLAGGPNAIRSNHEMATCWYCRQLLLWEEESFRQTGIDWLAEYSYLCILPSGPGTHHGGGSRRGH